MSGKASLLFTFTLFLFSACGGSDNPAPPACPTGEERVSNGECQAIADASPNPIVFIDRIGVAPLTVIESNEIEIVDINQPVNVAIRNGAYSINGGEYQTEDGTVVNGDRIVVRAQASAEQNGAVSVLLTVGDTSDAFDVTTVGGPHLPRGEQNWSMFGNNYKHTRSSSDTILNRDNIDSLRVIARRSGAGVTGTPAVVDGRIYYGDFEGWLNVIDAQTAELLWRVQLQESMLTPSVFVSGNTVYIAGNGSIVYAVDKDSGAVKWQSAIEETPYNRIWSSPVVVDNTLIVGSASFQVFFPVEEEDGIFRGGIVGLNASTGEQKWRLSVCPEILCGGGVSVWSSASIDTELNMAFIGTGQAYYEPAGPYSDALIAFNYETGEMIWHYQYTANDVYNIEGGALDHDIGASPNLFTANIEGEERQLVGVGDKGGRYMTFDRITGEKIWERTLGIGTPIGGVMGSAAVDEGTIYVTTNTSVVGTSRFDPVPASGIAYALDTANGDVIWQTTLDEGVFGGAAIANELMYFVTWDGVLHVADSLTGELLQRVTVGESVGVFDTTERGFPNGSTSGPVIYNGRVYVGYGWTWQANVPGGMSILQTDTLPAPLNWAPTCPEGFLPQEGLNENFPSDEFQRSFRILPATTGDGPRPVFVSLTGTAQLETQFMQSAHIDQLPSQGITVIAPTRICATDGSNTACNSGRVITNDGRTWEPWFDGVGRNNTAQYQDEGTDVRFIEKIVKCAASQFSIDQSRIYIGGISAGGTLTNRALTFESGFFAGGIPASGEWYRTDGVSIAEENVGDLIVEGRAAPRPLNTETDALGHMINIVLWGGPTDKWYSNGFSGDLIANYNPSTKLASNYYATQDNVVTISCTHDLGYTFQAQGHTWPNSEAITVWMLNTLISHPKGSHKHSFSLPEPPDGLSCELGTFQDH